MLTSPNHITHASGNHLALELGKAEQDVTDRSSTSPSRSRCLNPAAEDQATGRAHRIGQDKPVFVRRLITLRSIEEKTDVLKERKRALVATVLGGEEGRALRLTEADVEELFAPM